MYLSKLEIVGFKSFAQKTQLKFNGGLTAIVGPNGCGKTNIVDAIRWVLGEQKTAVLRSEIMENVIFNGTSSRKPLGLAEVSLTLLNNKNLLPTEYTDVTVTRRLFRNGESQYLLNNTQCRLRDIVDLFMDTGMGADSYSVIELKMVEAILSGKPEERRHLFEEAAGVTKYKLRRKEAGKKLLSVQTDLTRVQDIVTEIDKNVASLARQAAKTRRYNKLLNQYKELELELLKHEYSFYKKEIDERQADIDALVQSKLSQENILKEDEEEINKLELNQIELNDKFRLARDKESRINSQLAQNSKDIAVSEEKITALENSQIRLKKEIEESFELTDRTGENIKINNEKIVSLQTEKESLQSELGNQKELRNDAQREVFSLREDVNSANEETLNINNAINSIKASKNKIRARKETLENRIEESMTQIDKLAEEAELLVRLQDDAVQKKENSKSMLLQAENELKEAQERQINLQSSIDELQNKISENKQNLSSKTASHEFLTGLIDAGESNKFLITSQEWNPASDKILLAEAIGADDNYRVAVEAALGEAARYFVVGNKEEAQSAFALLKAKDKGKAVFICRDSIPDIKEPGAAPASIGVIGWVSEFVRADDILRNALRTILGKTLLVENIDDAINCIDNKSADIAVTLKGEIVDSRGILRGGAVSGKEGISVGKRERIDKLNKEIKKLKETITGHEEILRNKRSELVGINLRQLNDNIRLVEAEINSFEQKISQLKYKKESFDNNRSLIEQNAARFSEELKETENEERGFETEMVQLENRLAAAKEELQAQMNELNKAEDNYSLYDKAVHEIEIRDVKLNADLNNLKYEVQRLERQKAELALKAGRMEQELQQTILGIEELKNNLVILRQQLEEIKNLASEAQSEREFLAEQLKTLEEQIHQYTQDLSAKRRSFDKIVESIHQRELKMSEARTQMRNLSEKAMENNEVELENIEIVLSGDFSISDTKTQLHDIKDKLAAIGNVNFMALEEYDTQSQRLEFYQKQVQDLIDSEKTLQEAISEINRTAEEKFIKTFAEVNDNFRKLFSNLFKNEGEAELRLGEGNPLEADIEIIARPPGKKPHSIDMLSGGEKTLTAISLLFAIYLVKPSPFCILDEVDAPLDDANIDVFINLIRDFSNNTQFLIVTHNKRTMEAADTLYGITMQEAGISRVVSVRLASNE